MKRLILCGIALSLASGALTPPTVKACTLTTLCHAHECARFCVIDVGADTGTCVDNCTCRCTF